MRDSAGEKSYSTALDEPSILLRQDFEAYSRKLKSAEHHSRTQAIKHSLFCICPISLLHTRQATQACCLSQAGASPAGSGEANSRHALDTFTDCVQAADFPQGSGTGGWIKLSSPTPSSEQHHRLLPEQQKQRRVCLT